MRRPALALFGTFGLAACFLGSCAPGASSSGSEASALKPDLEVFAGTYGEEAERSDAVVTFTPSRGELLMHPALWAGPMVLRRVSADSFVVASHPRFGVRFFPEAQGPVARARVYGLSAEISYARLDERSLRPVQFLLAGRPEEAAREYAASDPDPEARAVQIGRLFLRGAPTRSREAVAFFRELGSLLPDAASVQVALGDALVFTGRRDEARSAYERAVSIDATNEPAATALRRLGVLAAGADTGWTVPFPLESLFETPTAAEIDSVWTRWARRDLGGEVEGVILRRSVDLDGVPAEARIVAHRVHGQRHLGVVIVPRGAAPGTLPVLVETKGVSASFFPLDVPGGLTSPGLLGDDRGRVVYVAPGYRGERIVVSTDTLTSEGDRSDAWDGATDDAMAFLRVALGITPEADTSRVCIFGRSRGGTVALLAGMREPRIDCVVAWAAPTDWFSRMDLDGWTQRELVEDGLRSRAVPGETGGQFINYFLGEAVAGRRGLVETRLHLLASSPLHFAGRLPRAQVHWGLDDTIVPSVNGTDFVERYQATGRDPKCLDVRLHPGAGHDQDRQVAPIRTREFLLEAFFGSPGSSAECRPS